MRFHLQIGANEGSEGLGVGRIGAGMRGEGGVQAETMGGGGSGQGGAQGHGLVETVAGRLGLGERDWTAGGSGGFAGLAFHLCWF